MNTLILIGKVKKINIIDEKSATLDLEVKRDFRNAEGEFESDTFTVHAYWWPNIDLLKEALKEKKDASVSINGRLQIVENKLQIICHKIMII